MSNNSAEDSDGEQSWEDEGPVFKEAKISDIKDSYDVQSVLGTGGFSTVYKATYRGQPIDVAIKQIVKYSEGPVNETMPWDLHKRYLVNEIQTLSVLRGSSNVLQLYDLYEDPTSIFMIFELIDGAELFDMVCENGYYPEKEAVEILRAVCIGLRACHKNNVMHRDIKPENVMIPLNQNNTYDLHRATLIDFGLAVVLDPGTFATEPSGSPGYVAPEILVGCPYDKAVDLWSLGVTAYIILAGYPPWEEDSEMSVEDQIISGQYEFHSPEWDDVSETAKDWIRHLLLLDPTKRMNISQALDHPFLKSGDLSRNQPATKTKTPPILKPIVKQSEPKVPIKATEPPPPSETPIATKVPEQTTTKIVANPTPTPVASNTTATTTATATAATTTTSTPTTNTPEEIKKPVVVVPEKRTDSQIRANPNPPTRTSSIPKEISNQQPGTTTPQRISQTKSTLRCPKCNQILPPNTKDCNNCIALNKSLNSSGKTPPTVPKTTMTPTTSKTNISAVIQRFNNPKPIPAQAKSPAPIATTITTPAASTTTAINKPTNTNSPAPVRDQKRPSVLAKYNPIDTTKNIPVSREKWDPQSQSVRTVVEIVKASHSLSQKPKFPQKGLGKPLKGYNNPPTSSNRDI